MCGIIGFSGNNDSKFDLEKIKTLMYLNSTERDSKDSTGFYTKEMTEPFKNVMSAKTLLINGEIDKNLKPSSVFIGHVRKSSYGHVIVSNAHPFKINNIIGVHNGTLTSVYDFCKKFEIKHETQKTDSYHLFKAIAKIADPSPLKYVEGTLAILFTDNQDPDTLYVYRNDSRELFYGFLNESMYISSERDGLSMIGCQDIKMFESFVFHCIKNGKITMQYKIESKKTTTTYKYDPSLTKKWVKFKEDNIRYNLDKDEFYFVESTSYSGNNQELTISDGFGLDGKIITSKNPLVKIPRDLVDLSIDYDFNISKTGYRCAKALYNIEIKGGDVIQAGDDLVIVEETGFGVNRKFRVYVPSVDREYINIEPEDFRACTIEEEEEIRQLLFTFYDDGGKDKLESTQFQKFAPILPEKVNEVLCTFNLDLVNTLTKLSEEKDLKVLKTELTKIIDNCEQIVGDYLK